MSESQQNISDSKPASITTIGSTDTQQSEKEDDVAFSLDSLQNFGWKAIFLLQFQPQFEVIIMISICLSYICSLLDITFAYSTSVENLPPTYTATAISFIYSFDVIYVVDILSMISYKNTEWDEVKHLYSKRHSFMILLDIISILPLDAVYYSLTEANMRLIYTIRLRYMLRIFRFVIRIYHLKNAVGHNNLFMELLEFLTTFILILITISCLQYLIICQSRTCSYQDFSLFLETLYVTSAIITSRGYSISYSEHILLVILLTSTNFFCFLNISGFSVGRWLTALIHCLKRHHIFANLKEIIMTHLKTSGCKDPLVFSTSRLFFSLFWKNREAIIIEHFDQSIVPEVMIKEINLDVNWDSLKHSHLFRNEEVHFLRFVAPIMKQKFMIPGEVIYKHHSFKGAMIYVISGVIQILSEEDGETPILSFSGGTCIGESTLFIDYPSTCTVICQSYCEINILYKKDFIQVLKKYPKVYRSMLADIRKRYKDVAEFQDILRYMLDVKTHKVEVLTLKWLKTTLQDLMVKDKTVEKDDKCMSFTQRNIKAEFDRLVFCTRYLDMLVVTEQIELVTDTVFLKDTCPCILQPDSFIVAIWDIIIAVTVLVFVFIYPYYASFQPDVSLWYIIYSYLMTGLFMCDIYIQLSTAIKTNDGIITEIIEITQIKLQTYSFIIDLAALLPIELFVLLVARDISWQAYVLFQLPRLLKFYKITILFDEGLSRLGAITQMYLKCMIYTILLTYYIAALFYVNLCYQYECVSDNLFLNLLDKIGSRETYDIIVVFIYLSVQDVTSLGMVIPATGDLSSIYVSILIVQLVTTLFYIHFLTNVACIEALKRYDRLMIQEYVADVFSVLQNLQVNPDNLQKVVVYIRGQLQYNRGYDIRYSISYVAQFYHPLLVREICRNAYGKLISSVPLFSKLSDEFLEHMVGIFHGRLFAPGEILAYEGEICKEILIIHYGFCEMIEPSKERTRKVIGPGYPISAIEMCFGIPVINTTITLTHCRLLTTSYEKFMRALQLFPDVYMEIKKTASTLTESVHIEAYTRQQYFDNYVVKTNSDQEKSFKHFGYRLDMDTKEGVDYHSYFNRLGYFGFIRYIFLRHTIRPYGSFLRYWEISRCIFAFTTAILSPIGMINSCTDCVWSYILLALDVTAWIDIYVRHHVCYFDTKGIEVTHPLKTAVYYWKHNFIIDVLGSVPFEGIVGPVFGLKISNRVKLYLKVTRFLQIYRIICGIRYLDNNMISPPKLWPVMRFIPIVILIIHTIAAMMLNSHCDFGPTIPASEIFTEGVSCLPGTWLTNSDFEKPLTPLRTHLYSVFVASVVIIGPGMGGFNVQTSRESARYTIFNIIGFWCFMYISAKIIAPNLFRNADLTLYQESMYNLVAFLSGKHIDAKLKSEVIRHFEYVWHKKKGKNLMQVINSFNYALQEDILLSVYGKTMRESSIFAKASSSFFRSVLLNVKHEIVINRGIICRVNDIHKNIYFLFKGQVEVLGADYNRLLILPTGSLFGVLDNSGMGRQTLTMVAKGHVELLCIENAKFHKIIGNYHNLKYNYRTLIAMNTDYLLGAPAPQIVKEDSSSLEETFHFNKISLKSVIGVIANSFNSIKQGSSGTVWDVIILALVYYVGSIFELYQITVHFHSFELIVFMYCLDALFVVNIYLNFQTGYEDEFGILITDKKQIALRYIKSRTGFALHVASVIPIELFAFLMKDYNTQWLIWSYCRCNRLIRIFFVNNYFQVKNQQLNISVHVTRTIALLVWISLLLQIITSLFVLSICVDPNFNVSPLLSCNWDNTTRQDKVNIYLHRFSVVLYVFTTSSMDDYFPNSPHMILFSVFLIILCRFLTIIFVAEVSATLEIVLHNRVIYEEQINMLRYHMVRRRTSPALLDRVWSYVCLLWKHKRGLQFPNLLDEAPFYLREGVLNSMFGYHLRHHKILHLCHVDLIRQIATQLRPRTFFPGDYIAFINDIDQCMYFIDEGSIDGLSEDEMYTERIEKTFHQGEMFGFEQGLYADCGHELTYRASTHTIVLILERKNWINFLSFFPASEVLIYTKLNE